MTTWLKLSDAFPDHPKIVQAGDQAAWLYICGLCYASRHLTDGHIPRGALERLTGLRQPQRYAAALIAAGLWRATQTGWIIHDYTDHQRTKAAVVEQREAVRLRVAKHRSNGVTGSARNKLRGEGVTPLEKSREEKKEIDAFASEFEDLWSEYPRREDKSKALRAYTARRRQGIDHDALIRAVRHYSQSVVGADVKFVKLAATFLNHAKGPWSEWLDGPPASLAVGGYDPTDLK